MVRQIVMSSAERSVTLTNETRRRADEALVALSPPAARAIDPATDEVLRVPRTLLTAGDPEDDYPVPTAERFLAEGDPDFLDAPDLEEVATAIVAARPSLRWLEKRTLTFLWKRQGGSAAGKIALGACVKPTGLVKHYNKSDFIIWLAADHIGGAYLDRWQVEALLTHELLHCDWTDKDKPALRPHQFEGFTAELEWYGAWQADLQAMIEAARQLPLFEGDEIA